LAHDLNTFLSMPAYIVTQTRQIMRFYEEKITEQFSKKKKLRPAWPELFLWEE